MIDSNELMFAVIGFVMVPVGIWILAVYLPRTRRRLARTIRAEGVVEGFVWETATKAAAQVGHHHSGSGIPRISYRDSAGNHIQATPRVGQPTSRRGRDDAPKLRVGQTVVVRYDPEDTQWVMVEGLPDPATFFRNLAFVLLGIGLTNLLIVFLK